MIFQVPALLGLLGLISVPIIIHIINRRKFRVVEWGPMRYLQQSLKTTRRRIRLEQLLLLLTRILFVAALALAIARPLAQAEGAFGFAGAGARTTRIIVIDDSLSMGRTAGSLNSMELARKAVVSLVESAGPRDAITLLRSTLPGAPLLRGVERRRIDNLRGLLDGVSVADAAPNWTSVLDEVRRRFASAPYPVGQLSLVTDLQVAGWDENVTEAARRAAGPERSCRVIDVGLEASSNAVLVALEPMAPVVVPGVETKFLARIRNDGKEPFGPVEAQLQFGAVKRTLSIPRVDAGAQIELPFAHRFAQPGLAEVTLALPADALPGDNRRTHLVEVREQVDLLLVDGEPSNLPFDSETDFLAVAFTIGEIPWRVFGETDSEWLGRTPVDRDLTILANVAAAGREQVEALEEQVRDGMGLIVFPGDQADAALLDQAFYRDGRGLLPARPLGVDDEAVRGLIIEPDENSPIAAMASLAPEALSEIGATQRLLVELPVDAAASGVRVLAHWDDEAGSPAILEKRFGRGRVLLFTVTADRAWSDWPVDPTFLLGLREASLRCAHPGPLGLNGEVSAELLIETGTADATGGGIRRPGAEEGESDRAEIRRSEEDDSRLLLALADATRAGVYEATWTDEAGRACRHAIALTPAPAESQTQHLSSADISERLAALKPEVLHHSRLAEALEGDGRELWRFFLGAVLAFLGLETALMLWVGRKG